MSVLSESSELPGMLVTTGEAAKLCAVDPKTIARWVDAGHLPSHRTAGGRRRIQRSDLIAFMRDHGMPIAASAGSNQRRIAVVDDDPRVVRAIVRALRRIVPGADCRSAQDGFSAGALLTAFRPQLVFLDIVMPGLSGVEVCEHIRSMPELAGTSIVIMSGHLTEDLRRRLAAVGADRFLAKPFGVREIKSAVAELLHVQGLAA